MDIATPVGPQIGDLGFDKEEIVRNHLDWWEILAYPWPGQVLYPWEKRGRYESGQWIPVSDFTACERDAKRRKL